MELKKKNPVYLLPTYSLTSDLLGFLRCGLQYRYTTLGKVPALRPVQLWFGQFIHGIMDEGFRRYAHACREGSGISFPLPETEIDEIIGSVQKRLSAQGLRARNRDVEKLGKRRAERSLNELGPMLFPLIYRSEIRLTGTRDLPVGEIPEEYRFREITRYEMAGVVDVISHIQLAEAEAPSPQGDSGVDANPVSPEPDQKNGLSIWQRFVKHTSHILWRQNQNPGDLPSSSHDGYAARNQVVKVLREALNDGSGKEARLPDEFELIIDYKGMRRPPSREKRSSSAPGLWESYGWQVQTYAHLREAQPGSFPVVAGLILYLNELYPSPSDIEELKNEIRQGTTDILPLKGGPDEKAILQWTPKMPLPELSLDFRLRRVMRVEPVSPETIDSSLREFDKVVVEIETCRGKELRNGRILTSWTADTSNESTCTACDIKTFCPSYGKADKPQAPGVS